MTRKVNDGPIIRDEQETVTKMIQIYCKKKHHCDDLCEECKRLNIYALRRLAHCQFGEEKSACSNCKVHCYKPDAREKIKEVMRFSGPWMLLYHPVYSIKHLLKK